MRVIAGNRKRLRRNDATEATLSGEFIVIVQPIREVHGLSPAPNVGIGQWLSEATRLNGFAEIVIEIGTVQDFFGHDEIPLEAATRCWARPRG